VPFYEELINLPNLIGENSEQEMIINFCKMISDVDFESCNEIDFAKDIANNVLSMYRSKPKNDDDKNNNNYYNYNIFNNGIHKYDENYTCQKIYKEIRFANRFVKFNKYDDLKKAKNTLKREKKITNENFFEQKQKYLLFLEGFKNKIKIEEFDIQNYAYKDFLIDNQIIKEDDRSKAYAVKQKCIFIPTKTVSAGFMEYWKKNKHRVF